MDKETLSNYGWIVICVLVLAVMIALASPFGKFVSTAVQSTTQGLFDVNQSALGAAGIVIEDNEFQEPGIEAETPVELINFEITHAGSVQAEKGMTWRDWVNSKYNTVGVEIKSFPENNSTDTLAILDNGGYIGVDANIDDVIMDGSYYGSCPLY